VVCEDGSLWTYGATHGPDISNGCLLGRTGPFLEHGFAGEPGRVNLDDVRVVACSSYSSLAITGDGRAWTWGDCDGGALGHTADAGGGCNVPKDLGVAGAVRGSIAYTNGAVAAKDGIYMWGGNRWKGGISRKSRCGQTSEQSLSSDSESDEDMNDFAAGSTSNAHAPRRLAWRGVAKGYEAENLILGHCHAFIVARKV